MKHLISIDDIGPDNRTELFQVADRLTRRTTTVKRDMEDKILANVFMNHPQEHQQVSIVL